MTTQVQVCSVNYTVTIKEYITASKGKEYFWVITSDNGSYISATKTCKTVNGAVKSAKAFLDKYYVA